MVYTDIVTFPRSTEVIRDQRPLLMFCHFSFFYYPIYPKDKLVR